MNETLMLYLFTRLDALAFVVTVLWFLFLVGTIVSMCAAVALKMDDKSYPKFFKKIWVCFAIVTCIGVLTPSQKSVAIILAGSSIMRVAKTEDAQRLAGKSVQVIEKYLDVLLKDEKK